MNPQETWDDVAEAHGVRIRAMGAGRPLVVIPGMEGDGTSCLHVALGVFQALKEFSGIRLIVVDYSAEQHQTLANLDVTVVRLLKDVIHEPAIVWGQSFGCLIAARVATQFSTERLILVSPFTVLPPSRKAASRLIRWTPPALYRSTSKTVGRWIFGPVGTNTDHPFFASLQRANPQDIVRRSSWLEHANYYERFAAVSAHSGVWFGARDRLIDFREQVEIFSRIFANRGNSLRFIPGAGHVVIPQECVNLLHREIIAWLRTIRS